MLSYDDPRLVLPEGAEGSRLQVNAGVAAMRKAILVLASDTVFFRHLFSALTHAQAGGRLL